MEALQLIECPRDAMQGWKTIIPAAEKVRYINALLRVGFHTLDFGSFVSPKLIPQMADTAEVLTRLNQTASLSRLLAIVANTRGAEEASRHPSINYLGFPFSISPTFQQRNTNSNLDESLVRVKEISLICAEAGKELVVYMSMGFGNPYRDSYNMEILQHWMEKIAVLGVKTISIADTVGLASPELVHQVVGGIIPLFPGITIGVHLHSTAVNLVNKMDAAFLAGCRRFDGAINGIGGCPMADDILVGNMDSIKMIQYFQEKGLCMDLDMQALEECRKLAEDIFK